MISKEIRDIFIRHDMTIHNRYKQDGKFYRDVEFYSNEGEDVVETIWYDGTSEGFKRAFVENAERFSVDEHVEMWIELREKNGVPDSIMDLVHDAIWIKNELLAVADELGPAVHRRYAEQENDELRISLPNGNYIVAELCKYGSPFPPEIAVCIQDKDGVAIQDIVLVRATQEDEESGVIKPTNAGAEVLVWGDSNDEDYTHKFEISEVEDCQ